MDALLAWADIFVGFSIPFITAILFFRGRIQGKHVWLMVWGFAVGSTWEFAFFFLGDSIHTMRTEWPLPIITLHTSHTFWDAGLFIIGYWLCLRILKTPDCCTEFRWSELSIMLLWGAATVDMGDRADCLLSGFYTDQPKISCLCGRPGELSQVAVEQVCWVKVLRLLRADRGVSVHR